MADRIQVPVPVFCNVPVPLITPETVASPVPPRIAAVVSAMVPEAIDAVALLLTRDPLSVKGSAVLNPFKSRMAPDAMVVAVVVPNPLLFPNFNVPELTVVTLL